MIKDRFYNIWIHEDRDGKPIVYREYEITDKGDAKKYDVDLLFHLDKRIRERTSGRGTLVGNLIRLVDVNRNEQDAEECIHYVITEPIEKGYLQATVDLFHEWVQNPNIEISEDLRAFFEQARAENWNDEAIRIRLKT